MTPSRVVRVGLVQQRVGPDAAANLEHAIAGIREAARLGARLNSSTGTTSASAKITRSSSSLNQFPAPPPIASAYSPRNSAW